MVLYNRAIKESHLKWTKSRTMLVNLSVKNFSKHCRYNKQEVNEQIISTHIDTIIKITFDGHWHLFASFLSNPCCFVNKTVKLLF